MKISSPFVTHIELSLGNQLKQDLLAQGFSFKTPQYTLFSAHKKGVSCTLYESGKLVVQGKEMAEFIEFYLEPNLLHSFHVTHGELFLDQSARIGSDESGKGDFFGPLVVASLFAAQDGILKLKELNCRDSKTLSNAFCLETAKKIKSYYPHEIVAISPLKYNALYQKFGNLNHLLAWAHATAIQRLSERTGCIDVLIDQFALSKRVMEEAILQKKLSINLTQRHKAEEDMVVAAASILARAAFLEGLKSLSAKCGFTLPLGASEKVKETGRVFARKYGKEALQHVAKTHFKTFEQIEP